MKRETWIALQALKGSVIALNALFCDGGEEKQITSSERTELATLLAVELSPMMLEDAIDVLTESLVIKSKMFEAKDSEGDSSCSSGC